MKNKTKFRASAVRDWQLGAPILIFLSLGVVAVPVPPNLHPQTCVTYYQK